MNLRRQDKNKATKLVSERTKTSQSIYNVTKINCFELVASIVRNMHF